MTDLFAVKIRDAAEIAMIRTAAGRHDRHQTEKVAFGDFAEILRHVDRKVGPWIMIYFLQTSVFIVFEQFGPDTLGFADHDGITVG